MVTSVAYRHASVCGQCKNSSGAFPTLLYCMCTPQHYSSITDYAYMAPTYSICLYSVKILLDTT